jgi:hypothetical protein
MITMAHVQFRPLIFKYCVLNVIIRINFAKSSSRCGAHMWLRARNTLQLKRGEDEIAKRCVRPR